MEVNGEYSVELVKPCNIEAYMLQPLAPTS